MSLLSAESPGQARGFDYRPSRDYPVFGRIPLGLTGIKHDEWLAAEMPRSHGPRFFGRPNARVRHQAFHVS